MLSTELCAPTVDITARAVALTEGSGLAIVTVGAVV